MGSVKGMDKAGLFGVRRESEQLDMSCELSFSFRVRKHCFAVRVVPFG